MSLQPSDPKARTDRAPAPDTVTTGPIRGSRKVYAAPASHPHILRTVPRDRAERIPREPAGARLRSVRPLHRDR